MDPVFLTLDEVLRIHEDQIERYGGPSGVRDVGLLQSAMGSAEATFGGIFLHDTIHEMAAAYLYGICRNHPFIDGNKRTAVTAAFTFLDMNGIATKRDDDAFYALVIAVAEGRASKSAVAVFLENHAA